MRRADRLFQLVQILRARRTATARTLAEELGVSERTVYRDVRDLGLSGVPIVGEAGVGYALKKGFELPPLMFDRTEIEALVLGARMVDGWADPALARAARSVLEKVEAVVPKDLQARLFDQPYIIPPLRVAAVQKRAFGELREAIEAQRKVRIAYEKKDGTASERTLWPLGLVFWGGAWTLTAWCELRDDFRNFRIDRIGTLDVLDDAFETDERINLEAYLARYRT